MPRRSTPIHLMRMMTMLIRIICMSNIVQDCRSPEGEVVALIDAAIIALRFASRGRVARYTATTLHNWDTAQAHFGETMGAFAACQIKGHEHHLLDYIRELEQQLDRYRHDDSSIMRAMQRITV